MPKLSGLRNSPNPFTRKVVGVLAGRVEIESLWVQDWDKSLEWIITRL